MTTSFNEMGLTCHVPGGAFYVFPAISSTGLSSAEFAEQLLLEEKVALSLVAYLAKVVKDLFVVHMQRRLNNLWKR